MNLPSNFLLSVLSLLFTQIAFSQQQDEELRKLITKDRGRIGISNDPEETFVISSENKDSRSGIHYVYIQQSFKGVKVYNQIITLAYKDDRLLYVSGTFINNIASQVSDADP